MTERGTDEGANNACEASLGSAHHLHRCGRWTGHKGPHRCYVIGSQLDGPESFCQEQWAADDESADT